MRNPSISVIIPTYNSGWSIERTLASVMAQRLADIEVIIIDDGSTDDLHQRVARFLRDPRFRLVVQENRGLAGARNRGIAEARALFVAPLDADDIWHPDFLKATYEALAKQPKAPFAYAYSFRIDADDRVIELTRSRRAPRHDFQGLLCLNSVGNGSAALFRKAAMVAAGGYDETLSVRAATGAEDWKLVLELATTGMPSLVERNLVGYRVVDGSMSQRRPWQQLSSIDAVIREFRQKFPDLPDRQFADARTMMTAWLLPAYLKRGLIGKAAHEAINAYVRNPLWFTNGDVARVHLRKLRLALQILFRAPGPGSRLPLSTMEMEGELPFVFLGMP